MFAQQTTRSTPELAALLDRYTVELTARDEKSIAASSEKLQPGTEVFVASLPGHTLDDLVSAVARLRRAGLTPVPHIVARNIESRAGLDTLLTRLTGEAGIDRALVLGGDRDKPEGEYDHALQIIESGLLQQHGIKSIRIGAYPEGHPRIPDAALDSGRDAKLAAAAKAGLDVEIVSQFCFDAEPILDYVRRMRAAGVTQPFRVGVAGPAKRTTLLKYAVICGVGASMRILKDRQDLAKQLIAGETPEELLQTLAAAQTADPSLGIKGVHFFTFGSVANSADWAEDHRR